MGGVFICYRRADAAEATGRVYDRLVERYGKRRVFKDVYSIEPGADFQVAIAGALEHTAVMLVVIGDRWTPDLLDRERDPVRIEIELAMKGGLRIIPVFIRGARMPAAAVLPASIRGFEMRNGVELRDDPHFETDVRRLFDAIGRHRVVWIVALALALGGGLAFGLHAIIADSGGSSHRPDVGEAATPSAPHDASADADAAGDVGSAGPPHDASIDAATKPRPRELHGACPGVRIWPQQQAGGIEYHFTCPPEAGGCSGVLAIDDLGSAPQSEQQILANYGANARCGH